MEGDGTELYELQIINVLLVGDVEMGKPGKVEVIHDFADPGWEQREEYDDFWSWFEAAVVDMVVREREEEAEGEL